MGRRRHGGADERRSREAPRSSPSSGVAVLGAVAFAVCAPSAGLRPAHPLSAAVRGDRARPRAELRPRPVAARGRHLHREPVQRRARARTPARSGLMQLLPDTARGIAVRTGGDAFVVDDLYVAGAQRPLRRVVPAQPPRPLRRRAHRARRLPRRPGQRRPAGASRASGSSSRRRGATSTKVEQREGDLRRRRTRRSSGCVSVPCAWPTRATAPTPS